MESMRTEHPYCCLLLPAQCSTRHSMIVLLANCAVSLSTDRPPG